MVDEWLDQRVPSATRRVDGAGVVVSRQEDRRASEGSGETGVKLGASMIQECEAEDDEFVWARSVEGRHRWSGGS